MKKVSLFGLGAGLLAALALSPEPVSAQESTLDIVKSGAASLSGRHPVTGVLFAVRQWQVVGLRR